jgi:hypothetical protein
MFQMTKMWQKRGFFGTVLDAHRACVHNVAKREDAPTVLLGQCVSRQNLVRMRHNVSDDRNAAQRETFGTVSVRQRLIAS